MPFNHSLSSENPEDNDELLTLLSELNDNISKMSLGFTGFSVDIISMLKHTTKANNSKKPNTKTSKTSKTNGNTNNSVNNKQEETPSDNYDLMGTFATIIDVASSRGVKLPNIKTILSSKTGTKKMTNILKQLQSKPVLDDGGSSEKTTFGGVDSVLNLNLNFGGDIQTFNDNFAMAFKVISPFIQTMGVLGTAINDNKNAITSVNGFLTSTSKIFELFSDDYNNKYDNFVLAVNKPVGKYFEKYIEQFGVNLSKQLNNKAIDANVQSISKMINIFKSFSKDLLKSYPYFVAGMKLPYAIKLSKFISTFDSGLSKEINNKTIDKNFNTVSQLTSTLDSFGGDLVKNYPYFLIAMNLPYAFFIGQFVNKISEQIKVSMDNKKVDASLGNVSNFFGLIETISTQMLKSYFKLLAISILNPIKPLINILKDMQKVSSYMDNETILKMPEYGSSIKSYMDSIYMAFDTKKSVNLLISTLIFSKLVNPLNDGVEKIIGMFKTIDDNFQGKQWELDSKTGMYIAVSGFITSLTLLGTAIGNLKRNVKNTKSISGSLNLFITNISFILKRVSKESILYKTGLYTLTSTLKGFGHAIIMAGAALLFIPAAMTTLLFIPIMAKIFSKLGSGKNLKTYKMSKMSVGWIAKGLIQLSFAFVIMSLAANFIKPKNMLAMIFLTGVVVGMFALLGRAGKEIKRGAKSLSAVALSMLFFGVTLLLFNFIMTKVGIKNVLMGALVIGIFGVLFALLGVLDSTTGFLKKGAIGLAAISLSLILFSIGLLIFDKAIGSWTWEKFGMMMAILVGVSGVAIGLGALMTTGLPILGAVALGLIGVALIVFGIGVMVLSKSIEGWDKEKVELTGSVIWGIGKSFLMIGAVAPLVILGAVASILMGIGLLVLSAGLSVMSKIPVISGEQIFSFAKAVGSVVAIFTAIGLAAPILLITMPVIAGMGLSLIILSKGLKEMENITNLDIDFVKFENIITALGRSFAAVGAVGREGSGLLKNLGPLALIGPNDVSAGIKSVKHSAQALESISTGLRMFARVAESLNLEATKVDGIWIPATGSIGEKMAVVLGVISNAFAEIGKSKNDGKSLIKSIFGADFKKSDVENGINSVMDAGKSLSSVADGIQQFTEKTSNMDLSENSPIIGNMVRVVGAIHNVFSKIGGDSKGSLFKSIFGADFSKSNTQKGIEAVKGIGKELSDIGNSLTVYEKMTNVQKSTKAVEKVLGSLVMSLNNVFNKKDIDLDDVVDGTEQLIDISKNLTKVGANYSAFITNLDGLANWDTNFNNFKMLLYKSMVRFAAIGGNKKAWAKVYSSLSDEPFSKKEYKRGAKNLNIIGEGLVDFSSYIEKSKFLSMDMGNLDKILKFTIDMSKQLDPLEKIAESFKTIADSLVKYIDFTLFTAENPTNIVDNVDYLDKNKVKINSDSLDNNNRLKNKLISPEKQSKTTNTVEKNTVINNNNTNNNGVDKMMTKLMEMSATQTSLMLKMVDALEDIEHNTKLN